ncbi:MAG: hypothetical protein NTY53_27350 [Kiritimatiellaeota bacterium]|nr:hypothetical protein [Kiritimatiellota bacterium]
MSKTVQVNLWLAVLIVALLGTAVSLGVFCFRQFDLQWQMHFLTSLLATVLASGLLAICAAAPAWMPK